MTLPSLFIPEEVTREEFLREDGLVENLRYAEPGQWLDGRRHDVRTVIHPQVTMVLDEELTGTDPSTGIWTLTVTPIDSGSGPAAADWMGPASVSVEVTGRTLEEVVTDIIAAGEASATLNSFAAVQEWQRLMSYVILSVSPVGAEQLRLTARQAGQEFQVTITAPAGNGATETVIQSPTTDTAKLGFYMAIDRAKGTNGYNEFTQPYVKTVEAGTPAADLIGPIMYTNGAQPFSGGEPYKEYSAKVVNNLAAALYGDPVCYGEAAIPAADANGVLYVRNTASGDLIPGMVAGATAAAAAATAQVDDVTPTTANDTQFSLRVEIDGEIVGTLNYLSDAGSSAIEEADGLRADLLAQGGFGGRITADAAGASPMVLTGPATGEAVTYVSTGAGILTVANVTPAASEHTAHPVDKILKPSQRIGSVPAAKPHP